MLSLRTRWIACLLYAALASCGGDEGPPVGPDPAIAPFVGTWDAVEFVVTSDADPNVTADLLISGSFDVVIEPSGLYTATLVFGSISTPFVEIGQLEVNASSLNFRSSLPDTCPASSSYSFTTPTYLVLDGPTCFDFNLDGEDEPAQAHIELQRR